MDAPPATRTVAALDVELSDDGYNGRQIGLVLDADLRIDQFRVAIGTEAASDVDGAVDLFGRGRGPQFGLVSLGSPGFFLAFFQLGAAEVSGLTMGLPACLVEFAAEAVVVLFQLGQAALEPAVVVVDLVKLLAQPCQFALPQPAAAAIADGRKHGKPHNTVPG